MTMADFTLLCAYWRDHPPVHVLAASYLGMKPAKPAGEGSLARLLGADTVAGGTLRLAY